MSLIPVPSPTAGRRPGSLRPGISGILASWADYAVAFLGPLALVPICLHYLGQQQYGIWLVITSISPLLGLSTIGIGWAVGNGLAADFATGRTQRSPVLMVAALRGLTAAGAVLALLAIAVAALGLRLLGGLPPIGIEAFLIFALLFAASLPLKVYPVLVRSAGWVSREQIVTAFCRAAKFVAAVAALWVGFRLRALAIVYGLAFIAPGLVCCRLGRRLLPPARPADRSAAWRVLRSLAGPSFWFLVCQAAGAIAFATDDLVIGQRLGAWNVALYGVGFQAVMGATMLWGTSLGAFAPSLAGMHAQGDFAGLRVWWLRACRVGFLYAGALLVLFGLSGADLIHLWARRPLFPGSATWGLMLAFLGIQIVLFPADILLMATSHHTAYAKLALGEALANLALSFIWVREWGLAGVIAATVATRLATNAWYLPRAASRLLQCRNSDILRGLGRSAAVAIFTLAGAAVLATGLSANAFHQGMGIGVAAALAFMAIYGTLGMKSEDRDWLAAALGRVMRSRFRAAGRPA